MATGVGRGRICLASFNSPTPKPPVIRKDLRDNYDKLNIMCAAYVCYSDFKCSVSDRPNI